MTAPLESEDFFSSRRYTHSGHRTIWRGNKMNAPVSDQREIRYRKLIDLGIALSAERNHNRLMELILSGAKELTNADGGTLYLHDAENRTLRFVIVLNDTLKFDESATT